MYHPPTQVRCFLLSANQDLKHGKDQECTVGCLGRKGKAAGEGTGPGKGGREGWLGSEDPSFRFPTALL